MLHQKQCLSEKNKPMLNQVKNPSRNDIWKMFDAIASTYDRTNRLMTAGLDVYWRKSMGKYLPKNRSSFHLLDCATGTGDQLFSLVKHYPNITKATGIDLSEEMILLAKEKMQSHPSAEKIYFEVASALAIPFPAQSFDCVTMSFGIRNVVDVSSCLNEIFRVLKPTGKILILETSLPKNPLIKFLHKSYVCHILPSIGGWISKQKKAYDYLHQTAVTFPSGKDFCAIMEKAQFIHCQSHPLTFGSVSIYEGEKP